MSTSKPKAGETKSVSATDDAGDRPNLGVRLRSIRHERGLTLDQVSKATSLSISSLSKVENGQMSLTFDNLVRLASGLAIDVSELFISDMQSQPIGRRSVTRANGGDVHSTANYHYELLCADISPKQMLPMCIRLKAHSMEEFGDLLRHEGEEFIYVLEGEVTVYLEGYSPTRLRRGDSIYIDSRLGHAYLSAGEEPALILGICSQTALTMIEAQDSDS